MSRYSISPLIVQNRLLSQAKSGARTRNAAIGNVLNNSKNSNNTKSTSNSVNSTNLLADTESKKNYTSMKSAADSLKTHIGNLFSVFDKEWDKLTEEETAKYRKEAEDEVTGFVNDYNTLIKTLTKENDYAGSAYLNQIIYSRPRFRGRAARNTPTQNHRGAQSDGGYPARRLVRADVDFA